MKILGRQKPIKDFVKNFRGRLNEISGDIGKHLDEHIVLSDDGEDSKKQTISSDNNSPPPARDRTLKHGKHPALNIFQQRELEIEQMREQVTMRERHISEGPSVRDILRQAQEILAKDERFRKQNQIKEEEAMRTSGKPQDPKETSRN